MRARPRQSVTRVVVERDDLHGDVPELRVVLEVRALTDVSISPRAPDNRPNLTRCRVRPCSPTTTPTRLSSPAMFALEEAISFSNRLRHSLGLGSHDFRTRRQAQPQARHSIW